MFRPLWAILKSQKYIMRKTVQCKIISCGTQSELSTRSRCHAVYPYRTNNMFDKGSGKFEICTTTNGLTLHSFPHYKFL